MDDDRFNEFIDVGLAGDLVVTFWDRHQGGAKADGKVVRVHHVVLTVLGQTGWRRKKKNHDHLQSSFYGALSILSFLTRFVLNF